MADRPMDVLLGKGESRVYLLAKYGNRHGLTAGATGTGKTVSLMLIAEGFSRLGVRDRHIIFSISVSAWTRLPINCSPFLNRVRP